MPTLSYLCVKEIENMFNTLFLTPFFILIPYRKSYTLFIHTYICLGFPEIDFALGPPRFKIGRCVEPRTFRETDVGGRPGNGSPSPYRSAIRVNAARPRRGVPGESRGPAAARIARGPTYAIRAYAEGKGAVRRP